MSIKDLTGGLAGARGWKVTSNDPLTLEVSVKGGRSQSLELTEFKDGDEPMVRFTTAIGSVDKLGGNRLRSALELNYRLPHGCLAVSGSRLVMTDTRPVAITTVEAAVTVVEFLARQADQYEKVIYGTDVH